MTATELPPAGVPPASVPLDDRGLGSPKSQRLLEQINREYALVMLGGQTAVMHETQGSDGQPEVRFLTTGAFHEWLRPITCYSVDEGRKLPMSKLWIASDRRRQYSGVVFDPANEAPLTYYNLWRGFAVQPSAKGSCARFIDHIGSNVCRGDENLFAWVMGWFAQLVQEPTNKLGTSLVMRGPQGTGKTIVGRAIGALLGRHYALVADSRYIVGRFNSHLASCLLLQLDEATWGGDHAAAGKLKDLITGEWQYIEYKGKEPVPVRNYVRLLVTGNNSWLVPAGIEERRFAVLDVGEDRCQDHRYFRAIAEELEHGGREALLYYLLHYDYSEVPLREIPATGALYEQKVASLSSEQKWWLDILSRGALPGDAPGSGCVESERLHNHYVEHVHRIGVNRKASETELGIALRRFTDDQVKRKRLSIVAPEGTRRPWGYELPSLRDCRAVFDRLVGSEGWDEPEADWRPAGREGPS